MSPSPDRARARALTGLMLALVSAGTAAQSEPFHEAWRWVHFTTEAGLPSDRVLGLVEASDGTLWVHSIRGLAWYDGFRWVPVEHSGTLPFGTQSKLEPDLADGVLLSGDGSLFRANRLGVSRIDAEWNGQLLEVIGAVPFEGEHLLLLTSDGLYRFGGEGASPLPEQHQLIGSRIGRTRFGTPWLSTQDAAYTWTGGRWTRVLELPARYLFEEEAGRFLAIDEKLHDHGVWSWTLGEDPDHTDVKNQGPVVAADVLGEEAVVAYESGWVRIRRGGIWSWLAPAPDQLQHPFFLHFQSNGDLWSGLDDGLALHRGSSKRWTRWRLDPNVAWANRINGLLLAENGELWMATSNGLFIRSPDGTIEHISRILGFDLDVLTGVAQGPDGDIWVSSGDRDSGFPGALRRRGSTWHHVAGEEGLTAERVHRIEKDRQGRLWFLGISDEIHVNEPGAFLLNDEVFVPWGIPEGLPSGRVYDFADGPQGELWFGTYLGISRWKDSSWSHWDLARGLKDVRIFTLATSEDGRLWFGHKASSMGLGYIDGDEEPRYMTTVDGLIHDQVNELQVAPDGALWITAHSGVSRYHEGRFSSFDRTNGLLHPHVWPFALTEGRVYIGTMGGGVYVLDLEEAEDPPPAVTLLPPVKDEQGTLFRWNAVAYRGSMRSERIRTRERLDDGPWSAWSTSRELLALGLSPGDHTLTVQAMGVFGNVATEGVSTTINVPPPFHRRPLFLIVGAIWAVSLIGLVGALWRRQRRHHRLLRASEEHYRNLVDQIPVSIHELDLEGRFLTMNPAGLRLIGEREEREIVGRSYLDTISDEDRPFVRAYVSEALRGRSVQFEVTTADPTRPRSLSATLVPIEDASGRLMKLMGTAQDVTDRELVEKERRELERQLRLAQKMEALGLLAGGVAHDFNNLLTVIGGHACMLENAVPLTDATHKSVLEIQRAQSRATDLTRQLLAFGSRQVMRMRTVELGEVVTSLAEMLRRLISEQVELVLDLTEEPAHVRADPVQIEQIIVNLAVNARDAMPRGGQLQIAVRVDDPDGVGGNGGFVVLSVSDTGVGMDTETQGRIYEPFFTTKSSDKGTGLGLSTVYGIVEQSGGRLEVVSKVGTGSTFSVFLPHVHAPSVKYEPAPDPNEPLSGTETILLVDDDGALLNLVGNILEKRGYTILPARAGAEALRIAREYEDVVHVLLTDVIMPGMNGPNLAREFLLLRPTSRVLYMSGYTDDAIVNHPHIDPESDLILKPFSPDALCAKVRKTLGHARAGAAVLAHQPGGRS